jgi:hypothetical protein
MEAAELVEESLFKEVLVIPDRIPHAWGMAKHRRSEIFRHDIGSLGGIPFEVNELLRCIFGQH